MKNIEGFIVDDDFELETYTTKAGVVLYIAGDYACPRKEQALIKGAKDRLCATCNEPIGKFPAWHYQCDACEKESVWNRYLAYPVVKYTGQAVFFDTELVYEDELPDRLLNNEGRHFIFEAIPYEPSVFRIEDWCESIDFDNMEEENEKINALIKEAVGGWMVEGDRRIEYDEEYYSAVKEARERDSFAVLG